MAFSFPPPDVLPNYGLGNQLTISWKDTNSTWSNSTLVLMKNDDNHTCALLNLAAAYCYPIQTAFGADEKLSLPWRVTTYDYPEYPEDRNPSYYLIMAAMEGDAVMKKFYSDSFYLYSPSDIPTTTYASDTPSSATTSDVATSSLAPLTSDSPSTTSSLPSTTSTESSSSSGQGAADKTAIGVGVGLGAPLAIALIAFGILFWRRQQGRKSAQPSPAGPPPYKDENGSRYPDGVSQNNSEGMQTMSELGSTPVLHNQVQSWQAGEHQQQSHLSELSADNSSTK